jgi:hypothetical protein
MGKNLQNWVHYTQNILQSGNRLVHLEVDAPEDVDPEEFKKKIEAADPFEVRLKSINLDKKVKGGLPSWTVKLVGEELTSFGNINPLVTQKQNYGVAVARSLQWPGAYSFFTQGKWMQIYVGNGTKYEAQTYYPIHPPVIR